MSESSFGAGSSKSDKKRDEELGEDVEEVNAADCSQRLTKILVQLGLSLFVLGCLAGALIWSFNNGEKGTDNGEVHRDASKNFSIFIDQWAATGTYSNVIKSVDGPNSTERTDTHESWWYQDDANKRIVHRLDESHTIYVRADRSYYVTQKERDGPIDYCSAQNFGYSDYIQRLGMGSMMKHYSDIERTKNHTKVFIYDGDPHAVQLIQNPAVAFLVTAYADAGTGALIGWDTYFESSGNQYLYMASYWYDKMSPSPPSDDVFVIPAECPP
ncbi:unnamed protein product, partial [Mesorhabditis spiculigera]